MLSDGVQEMTRHIWTRQDLVEMPASEFKTIQICLQAKAYRLLGFNWRKWITFTTDPVTESIVVEWE